MKWQSSLVRRVGAVLAACALLGFAGCGRGASMSPLAGQRQLIGDGTVSGPLAWPDSLGAAVQSKSLGAVTVFAVDSKGDPRADLASSLTAVADGDKLSISVAKPDAFPGGFFLYARYDPARVSPASFAEPQSLSQKGYLFLGLTGVRGYIPIGLVPTTQAQSTTKPDASSPIVTVTFAHKSVSRMKTVSSPPEGDVNKVSPITVIQTTNQQFAYIDFDEKCKADYNNDGVVDIIDLQPVAQYYTERTDSGPDDAHKLVDGDADPEINIGDLQPLAANYLAHIQGYRIYRGVDNGGGSYTWESTFRPNSVVTSTDTSIDRTGSPPVSTRPHYEYQDDLSGVADKTKAVYKVAAFGDGAEGSVSDIAPLPPPGVDSTPPAWTSTVGITGVTAGDTDAIVTWGEATDKQSPPVFYRVYYSQATPIDFGTAPYVEFTGILTGDVGGLTNDAVYHFAVRARDSYTPPNIDANTNEMSATPHAFFARPPAGRSESPYSMQSCSMATAPGYSTPTANYEPDAPIIVAEDPTDHTLKFIHYNGGWKVNDVMPGLAVNFASLIFINNKPYIAGYNPSTTPGNQIVLLTGSESGAAFMQETVDITSISKVLSVRIAYEPTTQTLGIAYCVDTGLQREVRFAARAIAGGPWSLSTADFDASANSAAVGASAAFDPVSHNPRVSYAMGTVVRDDTTHSYYVHTVLYYATGSSVSGPWIKEGVTAGPQEYAQDTSLYIDAGGTPTIAYLGSHDKAFQVLTQTVTLPMFDAKVAVKPAATWSITTEAAGDGSVSLVTLSYTFNGLYTSLDGSAAGLADVYSRIIGNYNILTQTGTSAIDILYATSGGATPWSPQPFDASGGRSLSLKLNASGQKSVAFIKQTSLDYASFFNGAPQPAGAVVFEGD